MGLTASDLFEAVFKWFLFLAGSHASDRWKLKLFHFQTNQDVFSQLEQCDHYRLHFMLLQVPQIIIHYLHMVWRNGASKDACIAII